MKKFIILFLFIWTNLIFGQIKKQPDIIWTDEMEAEKAGKIVDKIPHVSFKVLKADVCEKVISHCGQAIYYYKLQDYVEYNYGGIIAGQDTIIELNMLDPGFRNAIRHINTKPATRGFIQRNDHINKRAIIKDYLRRAKRNKRTQLIITVIGGRALEYDLSKVTNVRQLSRALMDSYRFDKLRFLTRKPIPAEPEPVRDVRIRGGSP